MTVENIIRSLEDQVKDRESSIDEADPDCIFRRDAEALRGALAMIRDSGQYTFHLCVAQDGRSIVDMTVGANAVPEEISKAKKTIQRLLNEFTPKVAIPPPGLPLQHRWNRSLMRNRNSSRSRLLWNRSSRPMLRQRRHRPLSGGQEFPG